MATVAIYFNDLKPEAQKEFLDAAGVDDPKEMNWDSYIAPLAIFELENGEFVV